MLRLSASRSHLYPGARGRVLSGGCDAGPAEVGFADGATAIGRLEDGILALAPYRTAAGTEIAAKSWRVRLEGDTFRVTTRADGHKKA